jgi:amidohydrolase
VPESPVAARVNALAAGLNDELLEIRHDLHRHPEISRDERRTTRIVVERLRSAVLQPVLLPGTGLVCDLGPDIAQTGRQRIALRADLDALPVADVCAAPWCSQVPGVSHACGHDVHTTVVLGAGLVLAELAATGELRTGVRLVFQAAEEAHPSGSLDAIDAGAMDGVAQVFSVHCDPRYDVGTVGTRQGPITSASDVVSVHVTGAGGHTSRPHLTADLVFALGQVVTQVPAILSRRLDPRSGVNLTWGRIEAGSASNAIPMTGLVEGTLRCLDQRAWEDVGRLFTETVHAVLAPLGVEADVRYHRGVPPVINDAAATSALEAAAEDVLGPGAVRLTEQSLGGEDFAWYLTRARGSLARLGTRAPGGRTFDLHQGDFTADDGAIDVGVRLLARTALLAGE